MRLVLLAALCLAVLASSAAALPPVSTSLTPLTISATAATGEKPQSKVWTYAGKWWCVLPNSSGTWIWRLDGSTWTSVLKLSNATNSHADVKSIGGVAHVLLYLGANSELASAEYVPATQSYQLWTGRPGGNVPITLGTGTETATIDVDSQGRMWLADAEHDTRYGKPVNRYGHLLSFRVKGGPQAARKVFDRLQMIMRVTDLGRVKSLATIPSISTHLQQGEEARKMAGVPPTMVRLCVGGEHPDDVIADLDQALAKI